MNIFPLTIFSTLAKPAVTISLSQEFAIKFCTQPISDIITCVQPSLWYNV